MEVQKGGLESNAIYKSRIRLSGIANISWVPWRRETSPAFPFMAVPTGGKRCWKERTVTRFGAYMHSAMKATTQLQK